MKKVGLILLICIIIVFNTACAKTNSSKKDDNSIKQTETVVSEDKPEDKPEEKPEETPETKPEETPEKKPETNPETKPESKPKDNILNDELKSIIEKIYSISEVKLPKTAFTEVTAENSKYYLGTDKIEYVEALASEPLIGSFPHSLVLIRIKDKADVDKVIDQVINNVNPRKWICVGVEQEDVVMDNIDNLVILIMDNESEKLHKAFLSLAK